MPEVVRSSIVPFNLSYLPGYATPTEGKLDYGPRSIVANVTAPQGVHSLVPFRGVSSRIAHSTLE